MSTDTATSQVTDPHAEEMPPIANPRLIHTSHPPTWWLGRYTALSDRFRTCALPSPPSSPPASHSPSNDNDSSPISEPSSSGASSSNDAKHPMHDTERRNRRVYIHLRSLCTTEEARASLDEFRAGVEAREREREAKSGGRGKVVREKQGWLEGLMGKGRRGEK